MGNEPSMPDLSQIFSKVMANPQAMAMLSSLMGNTQKTESRACDPQPCEKRHADLEVPCQPTNPCEEEKKILPPKKASCTGENRKRLLQALKPYLSPERCEALDRILMIAEALSLLQSEKRN